MSAVAAGVADVAGSTTTVGTDTAADADDGSNATGLAAFQSNSVSLVGVIITDDNTEADDASDMSSGVGMSMSGPSQSVQESLS